MHRSSKGFLFFSLLLAALPLRAQQIGLLGLRALNGAGAFHGLRHDAAGICTHFLTPQMACAY